MFMIKYFSRKNRQKEVIISHDFDRKITSLVAFGIEQKGGFIFVCLFLTELTVPRKCEASVNT